MSGARYLAETLEGAGVTHVFFVPTMLSGMLAAMEEHTRIRRVLTHGEKSAAYMADGYARATGRPGICFAQAIGASNLAAGLRDAWLARSPVIAITGTGRSGNRNRVVYQQVDDDADQFRPVTKWSARVDDLGELPEILRHAFRVATTGSPGPVHLQIPGHFGEIDMQEADFHIQPLDVYGHVPPYRPQPDPDVVRSAVARLAAAKRPIFIAGGGVRASGAAPELVALAERMGIPIATSINAKALVPADHPLSVGVVGSYSRKSANQAVMESDLVCFVGSATGSQVSLNWQVPKRDVATIHIDIDPEALGRHYIEALCVLGDAKVTLQALLDHAPADSSVRAPWRQRIETLRSAWYAATQERVSPVTPIRPERLCTELATALPDDGVVVVDTGHAGMWSAAFLDLKKPSQDFIRAAGSLGWSFPAAIGAKLSQPARPVAVFTGDGGFWYHIGELETAVRLRLDLVIVVNNNNRLSQEYDIYKEAYGGELKGNHHELWHFREVNLAQLAERFGATGIRVEDPGELGGALKRAFETGGPCVVDVITDADAMAPLGFAGGA
jgi:acetolactate synthase-1/2/3 large subunit